jgi:Ner family transcriptional regulator
LIAEALGVEPSVIWPERYVGKDGKKVDRKGLMRGVGDKGKSEA